MHCRYTWKGLVGPMWAVIRFCTAMADLTLVVSRTSRVRLHLAFDTSSYARNGIAGHLMHCKTLSCPHVVSSPVCLLGGSPQCQDQAALAILTTPLRINRSSKTIAASTLHVIAGHSAHKWCEGEAAGRVAACSGHAALQPQVCLTWSDLTLRNSEQQPCNHDVQPVDHGEGLAAATSAVRPAQAAVTEFFRACARFRSDEWRRRITDGHPGRVVLTYIGRLGAGALQTVTKAPATSALQVLLDRLNPQQL